MPLSTINLSELDGDRGFILTNTTGVYSGSVASNAGDINGDGIDDLVLGDRFGFRDGDSGLSYVVFGNFNVGNSGIFELSELNGNNGFVITNSMVFDNFGAAVSNAGDINGDGIDDLIIGAPRGGEYIEEGGMSINGKGNSYVIFGGSNVGNTGRLSNSELDGSNGFVITGVDDNDYSGSSVSSAGDVNGDGIDDIIIGASIADSTSDYSTNEGESYVVFGSREEFNANLQLADLNGTNGFVISGLQEGDLLGFSVSGAGDINGDGIDDLIISAPGTGESDFYPSSENNNGKSYVLLGNSAIGNSGRLDLSELNGSNGFVIEGVEEDERPGISVSKAGDINNDGLDDIIIGASSDEGKSYVVFGRSNSFSSSLQLSQLDGSNGFSITGINSGDNFGISVSNVGDFNGDNVDDIIIGAPGVDGAGSDRGASYLIFGKSNGFTANIDLANPDSIDGILIEGINDEDDAGSSVSGAGDVNGDGLDDVIIVAPYANYDNFFFARESYVIFGTADTLEPNELIGTKDDDVITGSIEDDLISGKRGKDLLSGLGGNDLIRGGKGRDTLNGGADDDTIFGGASGDRILGGRGNDSLKGKAGRDTVLGGSGDDFIQGGKGNDFLKGKAGRDTVLGGSGDDFIQGGRGNDSLSGNRGNDLLIGVDPDSPSLEVDELDTLTGGGGDDTFVLGNANSVFYDDENDSTTGENNFALITDLNQNRDTIQLSGTADLYSLDFITSEIGITNATLIYSPEGSDVGEVIAIFEDVKSNLSLDSSVFTFI